MREATAADLAGIAEVARLQEERDASDEQSLLIAVEEIVARKRDGPAYVAHDGGRLTGAGWLELAGPRAVARMLAAGAEAADAMLARLVARAETVAGAGAELNVLRIERVLRPDAPAIALWLSAVYERHGFAFLYVEFEMAAQLVGLGAAPGVEGVRVEPWSPGLEEALREAYNDAFSTRGFGGYSAAEWERERFSAQPDFLPACSLIASSSGEVVGFVFSLRGGEEGWIDSVGVRPSWRGRGVADALVLRAAGQMRRAGLQRLALRVNEDNLRAMAVYQRLGLRTRRKHAVWRRPLARGG